MKNVYRATTRICSIILALTLMFTAFPVSAFAAIDEPLNGVTGSGWEDFGGLPGEYETSETTVMTEPPDNESVVNADDFETVIIEGKDEESIDIPVITPALVDVPIGASGITFDLSADVLADFIAFMENAKNAIEAPKRPTIRAGVGDTGTVSWTWGEPANFNAGGYYVNSIPQLTLSTARPSEGRAFCAQFGPDPLTGGTYTAAAYSNPTILKLLIAHYEHKASAVGVQLAIWSITNNASAFATHSERERRGAAPGRHQRKRHNLPGFSNRRHIYYRRNFRAGGVFA